MLYCCRLLFFFLYYIFFCLIYEIHKIVLVRLTFMRYDKSALTTFVLWNHSCNT
jgi:hypothetical protein